MSTIKVDTVRPVTTDASLTLQGDSSGSGVTGITIDSSGNATLNGTANNLGTVTAGTLGSGVVFPAGHVVQVVQFVASAASVVTTSSSLVDAVDSGANPIFEKNITIKSGNSVLIFAHVSHFIYGGGTDKAGNLGIKRILDPSGSATTSTVFSQAEALYFDSALGTSVAYLKLRNDIVYLDDSTSSETNITYRLMHSAGGRGGTSQVLGNSGSTMTLMEIET